MIEFFSFNILFYTNVVSVMTANSLSFCVGLMMSLLINKFWVFPSAASKHWSLRQVVGFVALGCMNLIVTNYVISILVLVGIPGFIAKGGLMVAVACWNFVIMKKVLFR